MSRAYFDSSVLLAVLFGEARAEEAAKLWIGHEDKVSSILLEVECLNGLRRYAAKMGKKIPSKWLEEKAAFLSESLTELTIKHVDGDVLSVVKAESGLSDCRTLDAIHVATALFFKSGSGENLSLVTFDERMRGIAQKLGLDVLPP
ncbi:MAG TPA: type II toxin-antitoxin system VapC family toxin [Fibrobacteria bacterium]|nr:type II toxin-antitoxin system VapC family toxin [Fibrobacteria bacterium]